jgi:mersacidin/lichenicidin family type 2 lantibiotic
MSTNKIIRAWKDPVFRNSLSNEERALLPANPAGIVELSDAQLDAAGGSGKAPETAICTYLCTLTCTWGSKCPSSFCTLTIKELF